MMRSERELYDEIGNVLAVAIAMIGTGTAAGCGPSGMLLQHGRELETLIQELTSARLHRPETAALLISLGVGTQLLLALAYAEGAREMAAARNLTFTSGADTFTRLVHLTYNTLRQAITDARAWHRAMEGKS